jgi:hypothetical protein
MHASLAAGKKHESDPTRFGNPPYDSIGQENALAAAVLHAPAFLSGLSEVQRNHVKETWRRARLGPDCDRIELLTKRQRELGSGLIDHSQKMIAAAMQIAEK